MQLNRKVTINMNTRYIYTNYIIALSSASFNEVVRQAVIQFVVIPPQIEYLKQRKKETKK